MERLIALHIERLPGGLFLATSDEVQGLVAQGRTLNETLEIARDVARKLIEAQATEGSEHSGGAELADEFDYPLVIGV